MSDSSIEDLAALARRPVSHVVMAEQGGRWTAICRSDDLGLAMRLAERLQARTGAEVVVTHSGQA